VSLEDPFWEELKAMAEEAGVPLARLVETIDAGRGSANLSSALRLAVLDRLRSKLAALRSGATL
jgi:predicted DNA-binding ribbon-helix-helix protein